MMSSNWVRSGSLAGLVALPALAVAFLGGELTGLSIPAPQSAETREFNLNGQNLVVPGPAKQAAEQPVEVFLNNWQNTVRTPPSPRL